MHGSGGSVTVHIVLGDGSVEDRSSSWTSSSSTSQ